MILVPFLVVKDNLNNFDPADDALIQAKLEQASDAIARYLDYAVDPTWTDTTAPLVVQAATLQLTTALWVHRGDEDNSAIEKTWANIRQLLVQLKQSALA